MGFYLNKLALILKFCFSKINNMPTIGAQTASASSAVKRSSEWLDDEPVPSPHVASHSTSSPVKRARTALKNTAAQSKKLADQARDKTRDGIEKLSTLPAQSKKLSRQA